MRGRSKAFYARSRQDYYSNPENLPNGEDSGPSIKGLRQKKNSTTELKDLMSDYVLEGGIFDTFKEPQESLLTSKEILIENMKNTSNEIIKTEILKSDNQNDKLISEQKSSQSTSSSDSSSASQNSSDDESSSDSSEESDSKIHNTEFIENDLFNSEFHSQEKQGGFWLETGCSRKKESRKHLTVVGESHELNCLIINKIFGIEEQQTKNRGLDLRTALIVGQEYDYLLTFWIHTLHNQSHLPLIQQAYYPMANSLIFVLNSNSEDSFKSLQEIIPSSLQISPYSIKILISICNNLEEEEKSKLFAEQQNIELFIPIDISQEFDQITLSKFKSQICPEAFHNQKEIVQNDNMKDNNLDTPFLPSTQESLKSLDDSYLNNIQQRPRSKRDNPVKISHIFHKETSISIDNKASSDTSQSSEEGQNIPNKSQQIIQERKKFNFFDEVFEGETASQMNINKE